MWQGNEGRIKAVLLLMFLFFPKGGGCSVCCRPVLCRGREGANASSRRQSQWSDGDGAFPRRRPQGSRGQSFWYAHQHPPYILMLCNPSKVGAFWNMSFHSSAMLRKDIWSLRLKVLETLKDVRRATIVVYSTWVSLLLFSYMSVWQVPPATGTQQTQYNKSDFSIWTRRYTSLYCQVTHFLTWNYY